VRASYNRRMPIPPRAAPAATMTTARRRLGALAVGHDNNLNLLRVVAAAMVLVSHSFVLATGQPSAEPWQATLGTTPGGLAVDVFFAVSGFLVAGSLERSGGLRRFAAARALRIYPALWAALVLTALVVGLWFTQLAAGDFLRNPQTWRWLGKNAVMLTGEGPLPQAFAQVPFAGAVNGSLWTLRWELRLYVVLAAAWWLVRALAPRWPALTFRRVVAATALAFTLANVAAHLAGRWIDFVELAAMFFQGAALWTLRGRVAIGRGTLAALVVAGVLAAAVAPTAFLVVNALCLPWLALHLAYLGPPALRAYNRLGDYSYGVYIFAFPVQQVVMTLHPGLDPLGLTAWAALPTLALAVASWHLVEEGALAHKDWLARRLGAKPRQGRD